MPQSLFPRRYYVDHESRRVLIGLTVEQTREFELLEVAEPWSEGNRPNLNHGRWLELYRVHQEAWEIWRAEIFELNLSRVAPGQFTLGNQVQ